ncbi:hypothetical protein ILP92_16445 [Maribius pontilimi]|uniref:Uncharacterized protein n=1 Tax=Palleronia pontilimi TaxID=1964209 RepID=A0A934IH83_9RHOB|nr:hypothetical protein [Palleronia pontilimi]MBJ3764332.1 hypothetical protein [Palleronia pontilimi]
MEKYKWLGELFDNLDDLYRYAQFAGLENLKHKIDGARQAALADMHRLKVMDGITLPYESTRYRDRDETQTPQDSKRTSNIKSIVFSREGVLLN